MESAVAGQVRARGPAFPLRARVTLGDPDMRVSAHYRTEEKGTFSAWRSVVLTWQGGTSDATLEAIHERLVESDADAIEFQFSTIDFESPVQRVDFAPRRAIDNAAFAAVT